jgi:hypothetical protein
MLGNSVLKVVKATLAMASWLLFVAIANHIIDFSTLVPEVQIAFLCLYAFISLMLGGLLYNILNQK